MSGIKLTWDIGAFNPEKHYIYRSASPISPSNLPTPIAEVGQGISEYNDLSITDGETYHYFVAAEKKGLLCPADSSVSVVAINPPGPQTLIGGDMTAGFFGETTTDELITGDALATEIGLTFGTSQFSTEPWLKFGFNGDIIYISKKSYINGISWRDIEHVDAIYDDQNSRVIPINGLQYRVTLLTGAEADPTVEQISNGSEWNELLYKIHANDPTNSNWASYTDSELNLSGYGMATWTQETRASYTSNAIRRGSGGLESFGWNDKNANHPNFGWRPVLRLQL